MKGWRYESGRHALAARGITSKTELRNQSLVPWKDYIRRMNEAWDHNRYNLAENYLDTESAQRAMCRDMGGAMNDFDHYEVMDIWNFLVKQCLLSGKKIKINAKDCYKEAMSRLR